MEYMQDYFGEEYEIERNAYFEKERIEQLANKPKGVFKYKSVSNKTDLERICDLFVNNKIYLPAVKDLNDPLESRNSILLGIEESERNKELENVHVLSLSSHPLIPTMWCYYADQFKGLCIGFKTAKSFSDIKKMEYIDDQEEINWDLHTSIWHDIYKKNEAWAHEKEYRIVERDKSFLHFELSEIGCVLFGFEMEKEIREHIESVIPEEIPKITVKPDQSKFCLYGEMGNKTYNAQDIIDIFFQNSTIKP